MGRSERAKSVVKKDNRHEMAEMIVASASMLGVKTMAELQDIFVYILTNSGKFAKPKDNPNE